MVHPFAAVRLHKNTPVELFYRVTEAIRDTNANGLLDFFNDGTISPVMGTDKKGPTAVLKSVGKIEHAKTATHCLNQKFSPEFLGDEYKDVFIAYMRTFVDLGIHHIQFNVIDKEILLEAQDHPEKYGDLTVRVAGYSAYFVDLEKEMQDQIIERTEHRFG